MKIAFKLNSDFNGRIEKLMKECQVDSYTDLMNNALTMLEWAIEQRKKGLLIGKLDAKSDKFGELEMPILSNAFKEQQ